MNRFRTFAFLAFLLTMPFASRAEEYLLYWQVDDTAVVDGIGIDDYFSAYAQAHNNFDVGGNSGKIAAARAVMYDDGLGDHPVLLNIAFNDDGSWRTTDYTDTFIVNDDGSKVVGTGGGIYSRFTASSAEELSFAIELGNWENGEWVTLASSSRTGYNDLTVTSRDGEVHILSLNDSADLYNFQPWTPTAYSVPEPSAGLLCLIGLSVFLLRRKVRSIAG